MISGLKYSVHNGHKETRNFAREWGFANLDDPKYIMGGGGEGALCWRD